MTIKHLSAPLLGVAMAALLAACGQDNTPAEEAAAEAPAVEEAAPEATEEAVDAVQPDATGTFIFSNLPDKSQYNFRAFIDKNDNQTWDGGQLIPYLKAEPLTWYSDSLQVRARWEQVLSDTLRIKNIE